MDGRPLMRLRFTTAATEEIGPTAHGSLSIFPITGGSFEGERLRGTILGGADWVTATGRSMPSRRFSEHVIEKNGNPAMSTGPWRHRRHANAETTSS